ncbi:sigma-70 family RNA polymerase sigma factor [Clostridium formicaceticum]|uniref:ECF RNA polymerase sigma factor SigW n=1 Tax=Clostridium formicaceticum TaxID=1497 RepID=A0AAC9RJ90_9CLOT|nr:sigma-70 family RNA polymerase sigma factor [Clostridium formicaceticum]AOY77528.1 RNA polymerase subunit sigma-70 [Clostridium formicaceticum]ARE88099.1 ECF RNA polymerase sigma factor SigW [Clostridium formicaceticum]
MRCDEENYIKRLKKKKEDGLEFIVDKYLGLVKGTVYKVLGSIERGGPIEECINDVFLAIWNHGNQFEGNEEEFKKWVYKIAKYQAIDYYRKVVKREEVSLEIDSLIQVESTEDQVMLNEDKKELVALINTLQPIDRKIFTMKYFLGIKSEEIANQLGLTRTAVDNRVFRGKKKLNQQAIANRWGEI